MEGSAFIIVAGFVLLYALFSRRLEATVITPSMVFVIFGLVVGPHALGVVHFRIEGEGVLLLAELTLTLVLFGDAVRIDLRALRRELGLPARLLSLGLPLTILAGAGVAALLFPELSFVEAATLGAILAPTDAALGQAVVASPQVPLSIRQALNVESGLNDGIAVPVVMILLAVASGGAPAGEAGAETSWSLYVAKQIGIGPLVGIAVGWAGGWVVERASSRQWMNESYQRLAGVALALLCYAGAKALGGSGFIAAFVGGMTLGHTRHDFRAPMYAFLEAEGQLLMLLVFMVLGSTLVWPSLSDGEWRWAVYAGLSLTAVRMIPVALSLIGTRVRPATIGFLGWFGPRGLASVLFGLVLLEHAQVPHREMIFSVVMVTVFFSVFAHGLTAVPAARWYGKHMEGHDPGAHEMREVTEHPLRTRRRG